MLDITWHADDSDMGPTTTIMSSDTLATGDLRGSHRHLSMNYITGAHLTSTITKGQVPETGLAGVHLGTDGGPRRQTVRNEVVYV